MSRGSRGALSLIFLVASFTALVISIRAQKKAGVDRAPGNQPQVRTKRTARSSAVSLQTRRNLGKAYYEQAKYPEAIAEFQKVVASGQALAADHLDLGLALMQANNLDAALGELTTAKQMDLKLVAADYNLGILFKRELRYPDAEAAFKRVIESDSRDPAVWFNLGTVYFAQKKLEDALNAHQHVVDMGFGRGQNFYVASLFHTFTTLVRLKRQPEAQRFLKIHEKMRDKVPNISLQSPALEGGKYGAILVRPSLAVAKVRTPIAEKVAFDEITSQLGISLPAPGAPAVTQEALNSVNATEYSLDYARRHIVPAFGGSIAFGDYDGDGRQDLYVVVPASANRLLHNNGNGTLDDRTQKAGVEGLPGSITATFADYDNSGHPSLFVAGLGGVKLYHNQGDGTFVDQTERAGLKFSPGELVTRVALFDADNDGFLDLVATIYTDLNSPPQKQTFGFPQDFSGGAVRFYRNNGDSTFADATASSGLASVKGRMRGVAFADFDNDGYVDLVFVRDDGAPFLFINQGEGKFLDRTQSAGKALAESQALEAQVADFNHDGNFDLAVWSLTGYQVLLNRGDARFSPLEQLPAVSAPKEVFVQRGTVSDVNGDGFDDLLANSNGTWRLLANHAGRFHEVPLSFPPTARLSNAFVLPVSLGDPGKLNLLGMTPDGHLVAFEKQGPPARWVLVKLNGFKSNTQGIGTVLEFKAGNFYQKVQATGGPVRVFTGGLPKLDVVRITWPNQIVQNTTDVATNKPLEVRESERLASSCPLLYIWNGQRYVFLTDVLGVAPIGELASDGTRIKPYPEEFVRLPEGLSQRDGDYSFQITDELREVDYLDQVRLVAVDHPQTEEIYANEIYSSSPERPTLYVVRGKRFPVSALDDSGHDVLPLLREADGRYPTDFLRNRILGLAENHSLTLDLGEFPAGSPISLWLKGWVFWTDSNASRALISNFQLKLVPPYVQVPDPQGRWVTVIPDMGLPSGTNRTMRVDLTGKFLSSDHHVRIVTNLCVYWDQVFFTMDEARLQVPADSRIASAPSARQPAKVEVLPLKSADVHYRGFSTPSSDPRHLKPDFFDYVHVLTEAPWNPMTGRYTRYGDTKALLRRADDRLVVMATGDELSVEFSGHDLPPLKPGWKRSLFLCLQGWAKDGEPNTAYAKTVEPLPFHAMVNYPPGSERRQADTEFKQYLREFETRPGYLLIPPLAPVVRRTDAR